MNSISGVELGRLIQSVENLEQSCERLGESVARLEQKVEEQDRLIVKGRTALTVILGAVGLLWGTIELFIVYGGR